MIGIGVPLFFGETKSRVNAGKISLQIALEKQYYLNITFQKEINELKQMLKKYAESLKYYDDFGEKLYAEIVHAAQKSYDAGEIDIYRYLISMETAMNIKLEYLFNLWQSNKITLEINYFTL